MFHPFNGLRWTQQIGLLPMYGSANAEAMDRDSNPVEIPEFFFFFGGGGGLISNFLNCNYHFDYHIF